MVVFSETYVNTPLDITLLFVPESVEHLLLPTSLPRLTRSSLTTNPYQLLPSLIFSLLRLTSPYTPSLFFVFFTSHTSLPLKLPHLHTSSTSTSTTVLSTEPRLIKMASPVKNKPGELLGLSLSEARLLILGTLCTDESGKVCITTLYKPVLHD